MTNNTDEKAHAGSVDMLVANVDPHLRPEIDHMSRADTEPTAYWPVVPFKTVNTTYAVKPAQYRTP